MIKYIVALFIPILAFAGGYYTASKQVEVVEKVIVKEGETKTVVQEKIITRTVVKHPDGTTTETTREENRDVATEERVRESDSGTTRTTVSSGGNYRLGVYYGMRSISDAYQPNDWRSNTSVYVSRRIVGPVWIDVGGRPYGDRKEVTLGLAVTW